MPRRALVPSVLVVLGVAVLGTGCSSDPRELDSDDLHRLIERGLDEADDENALHFTEDEAECVADGVMADISDARLKDLGVDEAFGLSTLDFTPDEEADVYAALDECIDVVAQVAETLGEDPGLTEEQARCMAAAYVATEPFRIAIFSDEFDQALNDRIDAALLEAAGGCGVTLGTDPGPA